MFIPYDTTLAATRILKIAKQKNIKYIRKEDKKGHKSWYEFGEKLNYYISNIENIKHKGVIH
tara:strand:- start:37 stop:222 length:186 start_codon:yes stop_codon:yes gene_type:complete